MKKRMKGGPRNTITSLNVASQAWPTPRSCSGKRSSGMNRTELVERWKTPSETDAKGRDYTRDQGIKGNERAALGGQAKSRSSPQAPESTNDGPNSSPDRRTLNPLFVEALMGWPIGWTDCESLVTGLSFYRRRLRSEYLRLMSG